MKVTVQRRGTSEKPLDKCKVTGLIPPSAEIPRRSILEQDAEGLQRAPVMTRPGLERRLNV